MAEPTIGACPLKHSHYTLQQNKLSDCGPSCVSLMLHTIGHSKQSTPIAEIRQMSAKYDGHYRPDAKDVCIGPAMSAGGPLAALASLAYDAVGGYDASKHYDGSFITNLGEILRNDFGLANAEGKFVGGGRAVKDLLKGTSQPLIVQVKWVNGGGHFIVGGLGRNRHVVGMSEYCFSDPYYGLVSQTIGDDARTEYCPRPGVVGNFVGWVATI